MDSFLRVAEFPQPGNTDVRVLVRMPLPVQVVQQPGQAPQLFILAHEAGVVAYRRLHSVHVLA